MPIAPEPQRTLDADSIWALLRALVAASRVEPRPDRARSVRIDAGGRLEEVAAERGWVRLLPGDDQPVRALMPMTATAERLLDVYAPLCVDGSSSSLVVAHLGQTLDGQIATASGASRYITGPENLEHLHRLRALVDAVIVGASTVENDDPQLTTRLVSGNNPVRVVLDPRLRLSTERRLFEPSNVVTIVVCARGAQKPARLGHIGFIEIDAGAGVLPPRAIVAALAERGLTRLLVEGGGVTVSRFLRAGVLDRLQVAICPLFIGAGRPGVVLPAIDGLDCALRPATRRFDLGSDVLFDCRLERRM